MSERSSVLLRVPPEHWRDVSLIAPFSLTIGNAPHIRVSSQTRRVISPSERKLGEARGIVEATDTEAASESPSVHEQTKRLDGSRTTGDQIE
jgi:hypothetical protein